MKLEMPPTLLETVIAAASNWRQKVALVGAFRLDSWRRYTIGAAVGVFLALVGAFGTSESSIANRMTFWILLLLAGSACAHVIERMSAMRPKLGENQFLRWLALTLLVGTPMSVLSWGLARMLFGKSGPQSLAFFAWAAAVITGAMTALMMTLNSPGVATHGRLSGLASVPVTFTGRLAPELKSAEILAVVAEGHYLRVHTSTGMAIILMRLADAIVELQGIEGAQIHRSWWVARDAIQGTRRVGRRTLLILKNGIAAPVSRPNVHALRRAGWI